MTYTPHWNASQHAKKILDEAAKTRPERDFVPFRHTVLYTTIGDTDPRSVARNLAWLTCDMPLESRREILQMMGAIQ